MGADEFDEGEEENPRSQRKALTPEQEAARKAKLEKEAAELRTALATGDLSSVAKRVAWILNEFPHTRDSDVSLTLKYWEQYQPAIYNANGMMPQDLFSLERFVTVVRVRAKIQNEYGLFPSSGRVKIRRRKIEDEIREAVVEDKPGRRVVYVYSDETGKNQAFTSVASVWVMAGHSHWPLHKAIDAWRESSGWGSREIHFTELKKGDVTKIGAYLDAILAKKALLSFKVLTFERATSARPVDELVHRLHEFMVVRGVEHEIASGRIALPHEIALTVDAEQSLDEIAREDIKNKIAATFAGTYPEGAMAIVGVEKAESHKSEMVQLADLVAGSINRKLHRDEAADKNHKDDVSDMVIERLNIQMAAGEIPDVDATAWLAI